MRPRCGAGVNGEYRKAAHEAQVWRRRHGQRWGRPSGFGSGEAERALGQGLGGRSAMLVGAGRATCLFRRGGGTDERRDGRGKPPPDRDGVRVAVADVGDGDEREPERAGDRLGEEEAAAAGAAAEAAEEAEAGRRGEQGVFVSACGCRVRVQGRAWYMGMGM